MGRRLSFAAALLASVLIAASAEAGVRVTDSRPPARKHEKFGMDVGPRIAFSTPTGESDVFDHGIDAAVTFTSMQTPHAGIGFELGYLHWPSSEGGRELDEFFSSFTTALGGPAIQGTRVFVDAVQASLHVRLVDPSWPAFVKWAEFGAGLERATGTTDFPNETVSGPGWVLHLTDSHHVTWSPALSASAGFDVSSQRGVRVGPDASYRRVFIDGNHNTTFSAFGLGLHVRFGVP